MTHESHELLVFLGTMMTGLLALSRLTLTQGKQLVDQFIQFVDELSERQREGNQAVAAAVSELTSCIREQSTMLQRMEDKLGVKFSEGDKPCP